MCDPTNDDHDGYQSTNQTREVELFDRYVTHRTKTCQCGARSFEVVDGERMKPRD
jgi:hypothetical protein